MLHVEALWALNSWVDFCIIWMAGRLLNQPPRWRRFLFVTSLSTVCQVVIMLLHLPHVYELLFLLFFTPVMAAVSFRLNGMAHVFRACLIVWGCSTLAGGLMYAAERVLNQSLTVFISHQSISQFIVLSLILIAAMISMNKVVASLQMNRIQESFTYKVEIEVNGQAWSGFGFLDSGNHVIDPFTKSPVVFADLKVASELLPDFIAHSLTGNQFVNWPESWQKKVRLIPARTVHSSSQMMTGILCDRVACSVNGKEFSLTNVPVVFTNQSLLFEEKCNCLLNPLQLLPCHQI
ncbi:sigma-E processing peptidase SpoIIGA [Jeotgalibacillus proteolyticus]|uniref:sigma-E processing peptidase SpoIIGA n=1 Tax=Jeotgalibacillus proteolyticus TaxID=2082395 RepID=UPI003CF6A428